MSLINNIIREQLLAKRVEVYFVSGRVTKWYNAQRKDKTREICLLSGWYWSAFHEETGPFRSPSAAWRDAYYRKIVGVAPPLLSQREVEAAKASISRGEAEAGRAAARPKGRERAAAHELP